LSPVPPSKEIRDSLRRSYLPNKSPMTREGGRRYSCEEPDPGALKVLAGAAASPWLWARIGLMGTRKARKRTNEERHPGNPIDLAEREYMKPPFDCWYYGTVIF
jgi:hypothetical protein